MFMLFAITPESGQQSLFYRTGIDIKQGFRVEYGILETLGFRFRNQGRELLGVEAEAHPGPHAPRAP